MVHSAEIPARRAAAARRTSRRTAPDAAGGKRTQSAAAHVSARRNTLHLGPMPPTVFDYPACSTCRRAFKWLDERAIAYEAVDIVESPPTTKDLARVLAQSGKPVRALFNTSGASYREGNFKERLQTMSEAQALVALAADGKLIKRPMVLGNGFALVGFSESDWAAKLT